MEFLLAFLTTSLPAMYAVCSVNYQIYLVRQDSFAERTCTPFLMGVFALHWTCILAHTWYFSHPLIIGIAEALTVAAVATVGIYLYLERLQGNKYTGAFVVPMVTVLQLLSSALMPQTPAPRTNLMDSSLFGIHSLAAVLSYSGFALGAMYAIMYLLLYKALKKKRFGILFERLPALDVLANMGFCATLLGWVFLTGAIVLGVFMSLPRFPDFYVDPKFGSTVAVWLVYGLAVLAYFMLGWRGARSVYLSLAGFCFAVVAVVGSRVFSSFHIFDA